MTSEQRDVFLQRLGGLIREHGWALQYVGGGGGMPWTYTIGLSGHGHRELVLPVVGYDTAHLVLNTIARACVDGVDVADAEALATVFGHPRVFLQLRSVDPSWHATYMFSVARAYFGLVPVASQVVIADKEGRFPWHAGHSMNVAQPVLWEPYRGGWPNDEEER
ncbi:DUF4262 domain-containing protein [Nonomuraea sp. NPDC046802]|uniref:DUF4262 domain-containing protein n=1 Tax=Nonomuraea sp. NPDC046802 TaxID=3154919 RepID=UPI0033C4C508